MLFDSIHVTVMAMVLQSGNVAVSSSASLRVLATGNVRKPVQAHKDTSFCLMNVAERMRQPAQETVSLQQHGAKEVGHKEIPIWTTPPTTTTITLPCWALSALPAALQN